jgi:uncharacterized membrane protein YbhN (UPF0104 family)
MSSGRATAVTLASTAIANSMPGRSGLVSLVYAFRQYRRRGADSALAGWTLGAVFVTASVTLAVVAAAGVAIAGAEGAGLDLIGVTVGVLLAALAWGAVRPTPGHRLADDRFVQTSRRVAALAPWRRRGAHRRISSGLTTVTLTGWGLASVAGWGLANWVLDCGCLALSFLAVGVGVPWKGLLLAYGAGQLAANLPITPGGSGWWRAASPSPWRSSGVEGLDGGRVLLYRILSFWIELPVGWGTWAVLAWSDRRAGPVARGRDRARAWSR